MARFDAVIIGGGFYGATIAVYLAQRRGLRDIALVEREPGLLTRASYNNQARVHNGYHYPRSFTTAYRSRVNLPRFARDWSQAVKRDVTKLYAIARHNSKVTARQFVRFCTDIGAPLATPAPHLRHLFDARLIEDVFLTEEYAFDSRILGDILREQLVASHVDLRCDTTATAVSRDLDAGLAVATRAADGTPGTLHAKYVFNCAYSGLNHLGGDYASLRTGLKHEVTEMALIDLPTPLKGLGVTVMDGPFFSIMPFPARGLHTLSHVRYTPHMSWTDDAGVEPYRKLADYERDTRVDRMMRDVQRYMPAVGDARYVESLFEIKTVLLKNESDDGRPILFERRTDLPGCYAILGGKIDNIYDVLEKLDSEAISRDLEK
jgi:glycine/D-amino acid oxidase-like deaminating enzyme